MRDACADDEGAVRGNRAERIVLESEIGLPLLGKVSPRFPRKSLWLLVLDEVGYHLHVGPDLVERYMKRALAYGMFPGFFSHNASQGHYFSRPELYNRDRPLFKTYVPLVKRVAEAGWQPVTRVASSDPKVIVERWGTRYLTVFNDSDARRTAVLTLEGLAAPPRCRDLVRGRDVDWTGGTARITLAPEDVALLDLAPDAP
jgi:hypothetical protein